MSYLTPIVTIGGEGGSPFHFTGITNGATLKKIWVWGGDWRMKAIKVWLSDGQSGQFGNPAGNRSEFTFEDGEQFTSLSLWDNGYNGSFKRLAAIKFRTNRSREFFPPTTNICLRNEYESNTGSGICTGIVGQASEDIDCLHFEFINTIKSAVLTNVQYPTLHQVIPKVTNQRVGSVTFQNASTVLQECKTETPQKITKKSSWSDSNKFSLTFKMKVQAGIPEVVETETGLIYTLGSESTYDLEHAEEINGPVTLNFSAPPGKTQSVNITVSLATVDLPYTGTVKIFCLNDSVLEIQTSGTYKGLTYPKEEELP